jgi:hypothetical protein
MHAQRPTSAAPVKKHPCQIHRRKHRCKQLTALASGGLQRYRSVCAQRMILSTTCTKTYNLAGILHSQQRQHLLCWQNHSVCSQSARKHGTQTTDSGKLCHSQAHPRPAGQCAASSSRDQCDRCKDMQAGTLEQTRAASSASADRCQPPRHNANTEQKILLGQQAETHLLRIKSRHACFNLCSLEQHPELTKHHLQ